jgi:hypothetical protein
MMARAMLMVYLTLNNTVIPFFLFSPWSFWWFSWIAIIFLYDGQGHFDDGLPESE